MDDRLTITGVDRLPRPRGYVYGRSLVRPITWTATAVLGVSTWLPIAAPAG